MRAEVDRMPRTVGDATIALNGGVELAAEPHRQAAPSSFHPNT
jgi:hypothetical protein